MDATKHLYETTVIINAALEDPQVETLITRVQELITKNGGEITALNRWGRKRLAYPIGKKNNGYYLNIECNAPGNLPKALEHTYLLDEQILRFLTIRLDKKALKARELGQLNAALPETQAAAPATVPPAEEKPAAPAEKAPLFASEPAV